MSRDTFHAQKFDEDLTPITLHLFLGREKKSNVSQRGSLSKKCIKVSRTIFEVAIFRHYISSKLQN
jgi:hypothetical protein